MRNRAEDQIEVILIRHGETKSNREHRYLGKTDERLSEEGKNKLWAAKKENMYPEADMVFSSPMKRCRETAELLYPDLCLSGSTFAVVPEWEEMDFGEFEGKNYTELCGDRRYQEWIDSGGTLPFPGGESRELFCRRCERGFSGVFRTVGESMGKGGKRIACIVHGGTIMAVLNRFYGGEYFDYQVSNGSGYRFAVKMGADGPEITELEKL